jgi:hypothetical protein
MALHTELPVYRDTYKLVLEVFVSTKNFPKEYKYSLGRDIRCEKKEKTSFLFGVINGNGFVYEK